MLLYVCYFCYKYKFYGLCVRNPASGLLQIGRKLEKWQWHRNLATWRYHQHFWCCFVSFVKFSYWSNFHVNIISSLLLELWKTISFYKGLTRNPEIGNIAGWVFPNIWRLGRVKNTKFGTNVFNKMLLNAEKCQGYSF